MASRIAGRVLAGLAAAAVAVTAGSSPAAAAGSAAEVYLVAPDVLLAVHGADVLVSPELAASEPVTVEGATVTFKLTGMGNAVDLTGDDAGPVRCTSTTRTEVVCANGASLGLSPAGTAGLFRVRLKAWWDPRTEGSLEITFSGAGYQPVTEVVRVRAAEAVDLTAGPGQEKIASPGDRVYSQLQVKNTGTKGITGAAVLFHSSAGITTRVRHANCFYQQGRPTACFWDKRLVFDAAYEITMQLYVSKDAEAPGRESLEPQWLTAAEFEDYRAGLARRGLDLGQPGIDLSLPLKRLSPATVTTRVQTDLHPADNWSYVTVDVRP